MAANRPFEHTPILPSHSQIALAIAIIRSKPAGITARDYVHQLRAQVKRVPRELDRGRYLDLVAYWRNQFQKSQEECERLKAANVKLERSNLTLTRHKSPAPDVDPGSPAVVSKRKREPASQVRRSKRTKTLQETVDRSIISTQEAINDDFDFLNGFGQHGAKLTQTLYKTHKLCRQPELDGKALCFSLVDTSSALTSVMRTIAEHHDQIARHSKKHSGNSKDEERSGLSLALSVSARAFMSVLVGMSKLANHSTEDVKLSSLVIYELVEMFKTALNAIETKARQSAQIAGAQSHTKKAKDSGELKESVAAQALVHFLVSILSLLDKHELDHQQLFDGFAYVLLERVGRRLFYCTFGRHRSTTIEGDIMPLTNPKTSGEKAMKETESLAIRFEVKALVLILERAMCLAPGHMNPQTGKAPKTANNLNRTPSFKGTPFSSKVRLSLLAKERLQRTLITCMYGEKVDDEFLDVLTKPVPAVRLGPKPNIAKVNNNEVEDWYKMEVWRLVGWDVLTKECTIK